MSNLKKNSHEQTIQSNHFRGIILNQVVPFFFTLVCAKDNQMIVRHFIKVRSRVALSTISDNHADVVFLYQNLWGFQRGYREYLYTEIVNRLKFKG